jgi:hypothetical protein
MRATSPVNLKEVPDSERRPDVRMRKEPLRQNREHETQHKAAARIDDECSPWENDPRV